MNRLQCFFGIVDDAGFFNEIVYTQRGEEFCGSIGRKDMVRACKIIAQRLGTVLAHKDRAGILDLGHDFKRVLCHDFQMLGCNGICGFDCVFHGISYQDITIVFQRFFQDGFSGKLLNERLCLSRNFFCQLHAGSNQDCRCKLIVLCLG